MKPTKYGGVFEDSHTLDKIKKEEEETLKPDFWNDKEKAESTFSRLNALKESYYPWKDLISEIDDVSELIEMYSSEEDPDLEAELKAQIDSVIERFKPLKTKALLDGEFDKNNLFLTIHAGAGGTEASDWASMLMRMYLRWCERKGFKTEILELEENEGGIKSVSIKVNGAYAFGYLKGEAGVHRLVRISPFDSQSRRHTSFASVYATSEVDDSIKIDLKPEDYRLDTYRAGGAGGQHVNKTDSAVRITHYETGIVVQCQNERSQLMNKEMAFKMLKSRLYEYYRKKQEEEREKNAIQKKDIAWGSQIRSYIFQPYTLVKDHRTNYSTGNIIAVMDGEIDDFIESYLHWQKEE
ncbi:MAG TPA: peptide chain release factor 2 [Candidatus Ornithospirochaeta avicola]|uniref:Peptide chain release factor 2 n=1 Tax=Candidatus Ornithospirochaeta avicola TaxID=2840896 RepID=A0A9D1TPH4_9SPIO|nr:peptide chain release factor 2 [Candidatus Ornithospirochaeta avicola]